VRTSFYSHLPGSTWVEYVSGSNAVLVFESGATLFTVGLAHSCMTISVPFVSSVASQTCHPLSCGHRSSFALNCRRTSWLGSSPRSRTRGAREASTQSQLTTLMHRGRRYNNRMKLSGGNGRRVGAGDNSYTGSGHGGAGGALQLILGTLASALAETNGLRQATTT
jgi:hypothetical protein